MVDHNRNVIKKVIFRIIFPIFLCIFFCGCTQSDQQYLTNMIEREVKNAAGDIGDEIKDAAREEVKNLINDLANDEMANSPASQSQVEELQTEILLRAQEWVDQKTEYVWGSSDCSGYVSYAWGINKLGTNEFINKGAAVPVPIGDLQPGDAINNMRGGDLGHMCLFIEWIDKENLIFNAYDMNIYPGYANIKELHFVPLGDEWTVDSFHKAGALGPYYAQRSVDIYGHQQ